MNEASKEEHMREATRYLNECEKTCNQESIPPSQVFMLTRGISSLDISMAHSSQCMSSCPINSHVPTLEPFTRRCATRVRGYSVPISEELDRADGQGACFPFRLIYSVLNDSNQGPNIICPAPVRSLIESLSASPPTKSILSP